MTPTNGMSTPSEVRATDKQWGKLEQQLGDATKRVLNLLRRKLNPDRDGMQRIIEVDNVGYALVKAVMETAQNLSHTNQYPNEEVPSEFGYLSGYKKPKPVAEQVARLREFFPDIDFGTYDESLANQQVDDTEGPFVIPKWEQFGATYGEALQKVLDALKKLYGGKFYNFCASRLGSEYLRQHARTVAMLVELATQQSGHKTLIVFGQLGIRHRGRSARRARERMSFMEFGLGSFAVGIMLLTHPERLQQYNDLWIDCAGDEFSPRAEGVFYGATYFDFRDGELRFGTHMVDFPDVGYGAASGRLPQQQ